MDFFLIWKKMGSIKVRLTSTFTKSLITKKKTLLDYVLKIYNNEELLEEYDEDEIVDLIRIIKLFGGKKGEEL